ncbi:threonine-phosphate decarboxylase CobD [Limnochorda pilosa]|uniref:threonine-phosphate decarboxylase n=1 Tax=Limnochorda pilosa TaxID=1555112 RepID=A0A0K2SQF5_LIMPI|nr:threonine-phosphate decarboxylase CobD [Limnochorda pilosa]BAS29331.1 histidinol-phosphate aminotransferase [Limnochorda pilosa]
MEGCTSFGPEPPAPFPVHGGDRLEASRRYGRPGDRFVDLSVNVSFTGPPRAVREALRAAAEEVERYPEPRAARLRARLALREGVPEGSAMVGNGASELIYLLASALAAGARGRRFLVPSPTFGEYRRALEGHGIAVREVPLPWESFALPVEVVEQELQEAAGLFLCNPNNPTGRLEPREVLLPLARAAAARGAWLVVDESFLPFAPQGEEDSLVPEVARLPNLVVLRSLTKLHAIPGARLGVAFGPPELVAAMEARRDPWSVNAFAQAAGHALLDAAADLGRLRRDVARAREALVREMEGVRGLLPRASSANFLLVEVTAPGWRAPAVVDALGRRGILVRDCRSFGPIGERFFRTAVSGRPARDALTAALGDLLGREALHS